MDYFPWYRHAMDLLRSEEAPSTISYKKPAFQMSSLIVSRHEASATPNACETSICKAVEASSTALEAREGHPIEEKEGRQTILSETKEELPGSRKGSERPTLLTGSVLKECMEGIHRCWDHPICVGRHFPSKPPDLEWEGSTAIALVAMISMKGCPYFLQMMSNTQGRRDQSVKRTWSGQLSWSALRLSPGMYCVVRQIVNCSAQVRIHCARLNITQETVPPCYFMYATIVALLLIKTTYPPVTRS